MPIEDDTSDKKSSAISLLKQRLSKFETESGRLLGLSYQPLPHDIVISTTPKAGTTWVQQICHQIRCCEYSSVSLQTNISMDFEEISAVVPWIELAHDLGQDLTAEQPPDFGTSNLPRLFKTHCWYNHCPRFPKTIVILRDPCDVLLSFYRFFEGWFFEPGSIDLDTFAEEFWLARGVPDDTRMQNASYFVHLISWYEHRHDTQSVLILCYEDLVDDLKSQVRRIAQFMSSSESHNFDTERIIQHTVNHSTYAFMKAHESQFDEKLTKIARNEACGFPKTSGTLQSKINTGKPGCAKTVLSETIRSKIQQRWNEVVHPVTGCATYSELRDQLGRSRE